MKKLIVLCGPTASSKTGIAVDLAFENSLEIVSADSRQVYRGLDLGSGKDLDEYQRAGVVVPYHLIDIVDPMENFTLFDYQRLAYEALSDIYDREKVPIICGGTGLYIEAVLKNYKIPNIPENLELRRELEGYSKEELEKKLRAIDSDCSDVDFSSKKRIIRAIEVATVARQRVVEYNSPRYGEVQPLVYCTALEREVLVKRIDKRLEQRIELGLVDEVGRLLDSGVTPERLIALGLEYKFVTMYLLRRISFWRMQKDLAIAIHQFSKRQMTYFRGMKRRGIDLEFINPLDRRDLKLIQQNLS